MGPLVPWRMAQGRRATAMQHVHLLEQQTSVLQIPTQIIHLRPCFSHHLLALGPHRELEILPVMERAREPEGPEVWALRVEVEKKGRIRFFLTSPGAKKANLNRRGIPKRNDKTQQELSVRGRHQRIRLGRLDLSQGLLDAVLDTQVVGIFFHGPQELQQDHFEVLLNGGPLRHARLGEEARLHQRLSNTLRADS